LAVYLREVLMTTGSHRFVPTSLALLAAIAALTGCRLNVSTEKLSVLETRTFTVAGLPSVVLETFHGAIEVRSWDKAEVSVEIEKLAMEQPLIGQITVAASQAGDNIVVKVAGPAPVSFSGITLGVHVSPTARLRVMVPRTSNVTALSHRGSISAEAVDGKIVLHASKGRVTAARLAGTIQVRSGDGSILLDKVVGQLDLETDDGSIGVQGNPSGLRLRTNTGSVRVQIEANTVMASNWDVVTGDGRITLALPRAFSAEFHAETSDGSVRSSHPLFEDHSDDRLVGERPEERRARRRVMHTTIGDGGKSFRVRTGGGSIRIERTGL